MSTPESRLEELENLENKDVSTLLLSLQQFADNGQGEQAYEIIFHLASSTPQLQITTDKGTFTVQELLDMIHKNPDSITNLPQIIQAAAQFDAEKTNFPLPDIDGETKQQVNRTL